MNKRFHYLIGADDPGLASGFGRALTPTQMAFVGYLEYMEDAAKSVTYDTFSKHCHINEWAKSHGYDTGRERGGLHLKNDWHVSFYKSFYNGVECYYMKHSGYQHIWTIPDDHPATSLVGIVDEEEGGVVIYCTENLVDKVIDALKSSLPEPEERFWDMDLDEGNVADFEKSRNAIPAVYGHQKNGKSEIYFLRQYLVHLPFAKLVSSLTT